MTEISVMGSSALQFDHVLYLGGYIDYIND